ncbi:hypothetical protein KZ305_27250, partial [Escherichia coli]|uniref:hypothetical protein n=1 Tax=Escherichia coli TaxID=562 RepID=UPI001ED9E174
VGETAAIIMDFAAKTDGSPPAACATRITLDDKAVRRALEAQPKGRWQQTAATLLIVRDMIKRAGCALAD